MKIGDEKIKEILLAGSYIDEDDFKKAEEYAKSHGEFFLEYLFTERLLNKNILAQAIAESFDVTPIDITHEKIDDNIFKQIPELVARSRGIIAIGEVDGKIKLAMTNPGNLETIHLIQKRFGREVQPFYILEQDFQTFLTRYKSSLKEEFEHIVKELANKDKSREERDMVVIKVVDTLLQYADENKVSDVHIEPYDDKILVRFRIDGVMHDVLDIDKSLSELILTRIKILAKMRTDEHRTAQDGKLKYGEGNDMIDVRVSVLPVTQGEKVVMRLLSSKNKRFSLVDLGFDENDLDKLKEAIKNPHGMILVTGPTGSGKTTTIYAILKILNRREVNISTIEDPVEYDVEGINQIQVNNKTNLTFANGLRSIVRQDPDIIMVGEIRDEETASIAVNSALTGHLVLSTLHTNDSATTLPRLLDMKVEPFLVASTVNIVIAQRLVRKICASCRSSYKPTAKELEVLKKSKYFKDKKIAKDVSFYKGAGCKVCNHSGYHGRIGIFEVLEMNEEIKDLILKRASSDEITDVAQKHGMQTMFEEGVEKVMNGETTLDEILRVARE